MLRGRIKLWNQVIPGTTSIRLPGIRYFKTGAGNHKLQQKGRDYYNNTPMPGYKPYTYPHPLVSGGASKHAQSGKLDDRAAWTREW